MFFCKKNQENSFGGPLIYAMPRAPDSFKTALDPIAFNIQLRKKLAEYPILSNSTFFLVQNSLFRVELGNKRSEKVFCSVRKTVQWTPICRHLLEVRKYIFPIFFIYYLRSEKKADSIFCLCLS